MISAEDLKLTLMANSTEGNQKTGEAIVGMWKEVLGIDVNGLYYLNKKPIETFPQSTSAADPKDKLLNVEVEGFVTAGAAAL